MGFPLSFGFSKSDTDVESTGPVNISPVNIVGVMGEVPEFDFSRPAPSPAGYAISTGSNGQTIATAGGSGNALLMVAIGVGLAYALKGLKV